MNWVLTELILPVMTMKVVVVEQLLDVQVVLSLDLPRLRPLHELVHCDFNFTFFVVITS
jgi:hypothetical protein